MICILYLCTSFLYAELQNTEIMAKNKSLYSPSLLPSLSSAASQALLELKRKKRVSVKQLHGALVTLFVRQIASKHSGFTLMVTEDSKIAEQYYSDFVDSGDTVCLFAETHRHNILNENEGDTVFAGVTDAIRTMSSEQSGIVVASAKALGFAIPPLHDIRNNMFTFKVGETTAFADFIDLLVMNGFNRLDYVSSVGDLAVRGGIVDIFPPGMDNPIRFEFFGDEIDSIREFDPLSQRSIREMESATIISHMYRSDAGELTADIFDYLDDNTLTVVVQPDGILRELKASQESTLEQLQQLKRVEINGLGKANISVECEAQPDFNASVKILAEDLQKRIEAGFTCFIAADTKIQLTRMRELIETAFHQLSEEPQTDELEPTDTHGHFDPDIAFAALTFIEKSIAGGFVVESDKVCLFTEHGIFQRRQGTRKSQSSSGSLSIREFQQLKRGDLVVHIDKGIARFDGLETIEVGGQKQDCARLIFSGEDKMYLHMNYVNRLQKYSSEEGAAPVLSRLGTKEWERKKARTKKKLKDIARDLIKLYAKRKAVPGFSYPADTLWQKEMEASFMYEDTPDQMTATVDVKKDMEQPTPMDRLVCGDVGFGKTEVAIRAAFKAVQAGKQVAVLVPTTILAQQHYSSFYDRLHRYAVNIDVISRFRTKAEQKDILAKLKTGEVDILIGTHRLLSKDVKFRELGLLIVDEEQRFGVSAKEKLREKRVSVDTLTLTATPIPRTLNFSLMGARDISQINTPPTNRIPVETEVVVWNNDKIGMAIERELARDGQVFFVSDRVQDLEDIAAKVVEIVPEVRYGIAHGGMSAKEIERVMEAFMERKLDVLFATKIIESGIDIPNVNTMFVNRAQNFGLAELYQLRGRVGRSNIQAWCYLLIPPTHMVSRKALRRLQAVEEFTDLGSGFKLAMRDLEIRGAGNLLGAEQSGFIADMGFELYHKILDEAVDELKAEEFADVFSTQSEDGSELLIKNLDITVTLPGAALIPPAYINSDVDRYEMYKKLYSCTEQEEYDQIKAELLDRFGKWPSEVDTLLEAIRVRMSAIPLGFESVNISASSMTIELPAEENESYYNTMFQPIMDTVLAIPGSKIQPRGKKVYMVLPCKGIDHALDTLQRVRENVVAKLRVTAVS